MIRQGLKKPMTNFQTKTGFLTFPPTMFEIEIKSLLGSKERADELTRKLRVKFPNLRKLSAHSQLNHYFVGGDAGRLCEKLLSYIPKNRQYELTRVLEEGKDFSIRSREADGTIFLVIKASIGEGTSANAVSRQEFEAPVDLPLAKLDELLLSCGFAYQAKWSREREEYADGDTHITIDKNAGYGYLAEFEKVVDDAGKAQAARRELASLMQALGCEELPQDRLERMFKFYNEHWEEYYGTDRVFVIE